MSYVGDKELKLKNKSLSIFNEDIKVHDDYKKSNDLAESIFNINKENVDTIFKEIQQEQSKKAFSIIEHAIKIRPLQVDNYLSLLSLLANKFGYQKNKKSSKIFNRNLPNKKCTFLNTQTMN